MKNQNKYSPEVRERTVLMVFEHGHEYDSQWSAIVSISSKIGCTAEILRRWVRLSEIDRGKRGGMTRMSGGGSRSWRGKTVNFVG
jgi:transposase-like protein